MCIEPPDAYPLRERRISSGVGNMIENSGRGMVVLDEEANASKNTSLSHLSVCPREATEDIFHVQ